MTWQKISLTIKAEQEDLVSGILDDLGITQVQIEDQLPLTPREQAQMFGDLEPEPAVDTGLAQLTFYLSEEEDEARLLKQLSETLEWYGQETDLGPCTIETGETKEEDWVNNWKKYFHAFTVEDILITPSWETPDNPRNLLTIQMDPGTAFGTGTHESTKLCIKGICRYLTPGDRVLDVGCGSGILGLIALKLGASYAVGIDVDPSAMEATEENMARNGIGKDQYETHLGNLIDAANPQQLVGKEPYDFVLANLLATILTDMIPAVVPDLKPGAFLIASGILDTQEDQMRSVFQGAGLQILQILTEGEWMAIVARKEKK